jgi:hypothetical protein
MNQSSRKQPHPAEGLQQRKQTVVGRLVEVKLLMAALRLRKAEKPRE